MDNTANAAQVEPLIPPASCALIVTSRQRFTLPGLHAKDLNTLPPDDARDLLLKIAPRLAPTLALPRSQTARSGEGAGFADAIAKLCGYLPLALRLAGSALAKRIALKSEDYVRRLTDAQARLELIDASLSLSYELLSAELQAPWCKLAVFPDTFDGAAATAVWELEPDKAQDTLDGLIEYSLVEWNEATARYRLHDLARLFANARLQDNDRAAGKQRHATHYKTVLRAAKEFYKQGGEVLMRGLALFDLEWINIRVGQAWAEAHAEEDDAAAQLCNDYASAGTHLLMLRQQPRERIRWNEAALAAARRLKNRGAEVGHLGGLGIAYAALSEFRRAIEFEEQRLIIAREIRNRKEEAYALGDLGHAHEALGDARRAIEYHEQALVIDREIGNNGHESSVLYGLGNAYLDLGEARRAIEYYKQALAIGRGHKRLEGSALSGLGRAYADLGETRRAIEFHEQRLVIAREIGDRRGEGNALGNLGLAYADLGEPRRAIELYEQHLAIAREIGDRRGEGNALGNLGLAYADLGETRRAIEFYEQQLVITREIGDRRGEGNALGNLGNAYADLGETRRAIEFYERALVIDREIGDRRGEGGALFNMSLTLDKLGERAQAIAHAEAALKIYEEIEDPYAAKVRKQLAEWRGENSG